MIAITKDELKEMCQQEDHDIILINVLGRDAFNERHIRASINIPADQPQFKQMVSVVAGDQNREIVLYSAGFECNASANAARELEGLGFSRVYDYQGGAADWFDLEEASSAGQRGVPREHREWLDAVGRRS